MNASIILCTYNRASTLSRALESLSDLDVPAGLDWELLVVDNNSTDDTRAIVERVAAEARLPCRYLFEPSQGKSFALNTGIAQALGQVLVFTDDDVTFDRGWLRALLAAFDAPDCAGVGGQIVPVWPAPPPRWFSDTGPYRLLPAVVGYRFDTSGPVIRPPYGANMAYRRVMFDRYGRFRTDISPRGRERIPGEDTEFGRRVLNGGEQVIYVPGAIADHPVEARTDETALLRAVLLRGGADADSGLSPSPRHGPLARYPALPLPGARGAPVPVGDFSESACARLPPVL